MRCRYRYTLRGDGSMRLPLTYDAIGVEFDGYEIDWPDNIVVDGAASRFYWLRRELARLLFSR